MERQEIRFEPYNDIKQDLISVDATNDMISKYNQLSVNSVSINKRRRKSQNKTKLFHSKSAFKMMRNNTKPYPVNMSMVQKSPKESK